MIIFYNKIILASIQQYANSTHLIFWYVIFRIFIRSDRLDSESRIQGLQEERDHESQSDEGKDDHRDGDDKRPKEILAGFLDRDIDFFNSSAHRLKIRLNWLSCRLVFESLLIHFCFIK